MGIIFGLCPNMLNMDDRGLCHCSYAAGWLHKFDENHISDNVIVTLFIFFLSMIVQIFLFNLRDSDEYI